MDLVLLARAYGNSLNKLLFSYRKLLIPSHLGARPRSYWQELTVQPQKSSIQIAFWDIKKDRIFNKTCKTGPLKTSMGCFEKLD